MRLGVSLAGFAAAAETANVVDRAVEPGSQAGRLGLDSVWLAGRTSCPQQRRPDASGDSNPRAPCRPWRSGDGAAGLVLYGGVLFRPDEIRAMATMYSGFRVTGVCQAAG